MAFYVSDACISCGLCQRICRKDAIIESTYQFQILAEKCLDCADCLEVCPVDCILSEPGMEALGEALPLGGRKGTNGT